MPTLPGDNPSAPAFFFAGTNATMRRSCRLVVPSIRSKKSALFLQTKIESSQNEKYEGNGFDVSYLASI
jgi:hypothetical protein